MKGLIDKSKKSNIKCEHCKWWCLCFTYSEGVDKCCTNSHSEHYAKRRNYWNRCKQFEWSPSLTYCSAEDKARQEKEKQEKQMIAKVNKAIADLKEFCDSHSCSACPMQENCTHRLITYWSNI